LTDGGGGGGNVLHHVKREGEVSGGICPWGEMSGSPDQAAVHYNNNNNSNNNKHNNVYGVVIMAEPLREFTRFIL